MMTFEELENEIEIMLHTLRVSYSKEHLIEKVSVQFPVEEFGVLVCGLLYTADYRLVSDAVNEAYKDWRVVYVTVDDQMAEIKEEVIWELMRGGYLRWLRFEFPIQFKQLIVMGNFANRIVNERLKRMTELPRFNYMIKANEEAKINSASYVLAIDPGFYDWMP